jgi:uracil-DNA glycosylase
VIVCLGAFAWKAAARLYGLRPRPRFGHAVEFEIDRGPVLLGCFHPSQQNTFTGKLTEPMTDHVLSRAREIAALDPVRT